VRAPAVEVMRRAVIGADDAEGRRSWFLRAMDALRPLASTIERTAILRARPRASAIVTSHARVGRRSTPTGLPRKTTVAPASPAERHSHSSACRHAEPRRPRWMGSPAPFGPMVPTVALTAATGADAESE
jgi:hypothetical protein